MCDRVPGPFNDAVDLNVRQREEFAKRHPIGEKEMKRIQASFDRAQAAWIEEFGRLDEIALDVFHGKRGGFIRKYADAWSHADAWNKRLMRPAWVEFIVKYNLEVDPEGTGLEAEVSC